MEPMLDLLVVGGGPAGLATAIRARQAGLSVRVLDAGRPPIDKACGEGLMPDGVALLERLGVDIPPHRRFAFRGIRYVDGGLVADGTFPGAPGWGVRRPVLHEAMVARAQALGAEIRWGVAARGLAAMDAISGGGAPRAEEAPGHPPAGRCVAVSTAAGVERARFVVAADGLRSMLRRAAGLELAPVARARLGLRRHFALAPWTDRVEVHWADGAEAYVTPVAADLVGVAILFEGSGPGFDQLLARFPALAARLAGAPAASRDRGAGPLEQRVGRVAGGNLALVGDAAGYVDAITGEGMALAFHQAFAAVEAIASGSLSAYPAAHRRIARLPEAFARLLLAVERRPWLRRRVMRALASDPRLFEAILALHVRARPLHPWTERAASRLAWRLLVPGHPARP